MTELLCDTPLRWPSGVSETPLKSRELSNNFQQNLTIDEALHMLEEEIGALAPERAVLHSDYAQLNVERLRKKQGNQPGTWLEIKYHGKVYAFTCDKWSLIEQNIYALHLVVRNYRLMEKWGVADLPKLMAGFASGHLATTTAAEAGVAHEEWMQILGLGPTATVDDAHAVYRRRAKLAANDPENLIILNNAMDSARKKLG